NEARPSTGPRFQSHDIYALKSVVDAQISPDAARIAYTVQSHDRPGPPSAQIRVMDVSTGTSISLTSDDDAGSTPRWSPDGQRIAWFGRAEQRAGLMVAARDGSGKTWLAPVLGTNHPLPSTGERLAWSPDGRQIAFVSAVPGPETENTGTDPI